MVKYQSSEMFPIVNSEGAVVGMATRKECHSGSKLLHPVVHLHVFDGNGRLFLQKRSMLKDIQPGKWDTSVGGHVDYGEDVDTALRREAKEELGLDAIFPEPLFTYEFESDVERELVNSFKCYAEMDDISFDADEIDDGRFFSRIEIEDMIANELTTPNFVMEFERIKAIDDFE